MNKMINTGTASTEQLGTTVVGQKNISHGSNYGQRSKRAQNHQIPVLRK